MKVIGGYQVTVFEFDNLKDFENNLDVFNKMKPEGCTEVIKDIPITSDNKGRIFKEIKYIF
jgi:hypothetical protein